MPSLNQTLVGDLHDRRTLFPILADLSIHQIRLITNNPDEYSGLSSYGISITERVTLPPEPTPHNIAYLTTKPTGCGASSNSQKRAYRANKTV